MRRRIARITEVEFARGPDDHIEHAISHVLLHAQQPQCRAALAGRTECRNDHIIRDLLGQRRRIDDHGVDAAGLGDQWHYRPILGRQCAVDAAAISVEPVKATPATRRSATSKAPTCRRPERDSARRRDARAMQQPGSPRRQQVASAQPALPRRCFPQRARQAICPEKIASGKFHGLMQTKTPRPLMRSSLHLAGRTGQDLRRKHMARVAAHSNRQ